MPLSRRDYWKPKLERNAARDEKNDAALRELGWRLCVVWECELKTPEMVNRVAQSVLRNLSR